MRKRFSIVHVISAILLVLTVSSCAEISLNDPTGLIPDLSHTIFYNRYHHDAYPASRDIPELMRVDADGSGKRSISDSAYITSSPRNGKVVFIHFDPSQDSNQVILCNADGSEKQIIASGYFIGAELSFDASFAILTSRKVKYNGNTSEKQLYRVLLNGLSISKPEIFNNIKFEDDVLPALSPDGLQIAFISEKGGQAKNELQVISSDPTAAPSSNCHIQMEVQPGGSARLSWSSDNKTIICRDEGFGKNLFKINTKTNTYERLLLSPGLQAEEGIFAPDGKTTLVAISKPPYRNSDLYEIGDSTSVITNNALRADHIGGYSADGNFIVYSNIDINYPSNQYTTRSMNVYDRLLKKDTSLDLGVTNCYFSK